MSWQGNYLRQTVQGFWPTDLRSDERSMFPTVVPSAGRTLFSPAASELVPPSATRWHRHAAIGPANPDATSDPWGTPACSCGMSVGAAFIL